MISLIIPVFNEEAVLPALFQRLEGIASAIGPHEVIFIDDGSRDATAAIITRQIGIHGAVNPLRLLSFSRNFGHQIALSAGLDHVQGDAAVILDGDLQDPPELVQEFMMRWREGADIVYAIRRKRKESLFKRICYAAFYRVQHKLANVDIPLDSGDFCLLDRKVVDFIKSLPEHHRFLRGLRAWSGFSSVGVEYERDARAAGETKYSMRKLVRLASDGILGFSTVPLKFSMYLGFVISAISVIAGLVLFVYHFAGGTAPQGWTSLMIALFFMGGLQLFVLGILGEYLGRVYLEVQNRPLYVVKKKAGF